MKINQLKTALLALCCAAIAFEVWHFRSAPASHRQLPPSATQKNKPDFVLLEASQVTGLARFFAGPQASIASWEPTVGDMNDIEANLAQIPELSKKDPDPGSHIDNTLEYFRQYGAVVIDGRKSILVNAFCANGQDKSGSWRKTLVIALDGGRCYWQALYDVQTARFIKLSVNGVG